MTSTKARRATQRQTVKSEAAGQTYHLCPKCGRGWKSKHKAARCCKGER